jgi:hypothetical protein
MQRDWQALKNYYSSPAWAAKRTERLKIDGFRCAKCGFTRALEVHHINYDRFGHEDVSKDLITLCKKCHKEIEAQKKEHDPVRTEHHTVYLAGKIGFHDWRERFYYVAFWEHFPVNELSERFVHVSDELTVTGPFFISCDHGCYHGKNKHGVGAVDSLHSEHEWGGCMGNYYTRQDVLNICKRQIDRAEIVFAYIDEGDCYGTLAEIGYAHAKGKDIVIVFSNEKLRREMWFADKMQQRTGDISERWIKEQLLTPIQKEIQEDN